MRISATGRSIVLFILGPLALPCASPGRAATIHVPADFPSIQAGIDAAQPGDTVRVAQGVYPEHDVAMRSGVALLGTGTSGGTILDAAGQGRALRCENVDDTARVEDLVLRGGVAGEGGCLECRFSSPRFARCVIEEGQARTGGGVRCWYSSPVFASCLFRCNVATDPAGWWSSGGGAACSGGAPVFVDCSFVENFALHEGGGVYTQTGSAPRFERCLFAGNDVQASVGGGLACSEADVLGSVFLENTAPHGGGIACTSVPSARIEGCTFLRNTGQYGGGAVTCVFGASPEIHASILAFSRGGEAVDCWDAGASPSLSCCDVFGNAGGDWVGCLDGQLSTAGNFSRWPLFCDPPSDRPTLMAGSPCLPGNNGCGVLIGALGLGCIGPVAVEPLSWGRVKGLFRD